MTYERASSFLQAARRASRARSEELFRCVDIVEGLALSADNPEIAEALFMAAAKLLEYPA